MATALDEIIDYAEQTASTYGVEAPMEQAGSWPGCWWRPARWWPPRCAPCATGSDFEPHLVEINRLENEGDRLSRDAVATLFATGIDPMVVIRWNDIFESLAAGVDACEHVAHVLEGISIKRRS